MIRRAVSTFAWLEELAGTRRGAVALFGAALVVSAVQAVAWPLVGGRDLDEYLYFYVQLPDSHPLLPWSVLFRTPVTPILTGLSLSVAGGVLAEPVAAILYALSIVAWSAAALAFGRRVAVVTAAALLLYPGYGLMFHELGSEAVMATAFAGWALVVTRAAARPSAARFALAGLGVALLALARPGNVVLLAFALFPLALRGTWTDRLRWAAVFAGAAVIPLAGWGVNNGLRYGEYTLARGGNAVIPFYRAYLFDRIISPKNGPASRRLADAIRRRLLIRDPYKSYGVTLDEIFATPSFRVHEDLYLLSDQVWGWNSNYSTLRDAALEGIRARPGAYASGVLDTVWQQLSTPFYRALPGAAAEAPVEQSPDVTVGGKRLPRPSEGQLIPPGQSVWISRPDQSIREVWTSATTHSFVFSDPREKPRFHQIARRLDTLFARLPTRRPNAELALRLNQASRWYPRPVLWLAVGLIALVIRRPRGSRTLVALALAGLLVVVFNALGLGVDLHYMLPVAPAFVLFGVGGLLGRKAQPF